MAPSFGFPSRKRVKDQQKELPMFSWLRYVPYMWKAIAAFLGSMGIMLPWADLMNVVDVTAFLKVLVAQGWQAALLSLIPAILTYFAKNKQIPIVNLSVVK